MLKKSALMVGVIGVFFLSLGGCTRYYTGPVSDHFNGTTFFNPGKLREDGFSDFLKWRLTAEKNRGRQSCKRL
jgi:hypothetical protein